MQRYILTYDSQELILQYAPEGWDNLQYTITRNATYHGLFFDFSGTLRFPKDGKSFIDSIFSVAGFEAEIGIIIQELDQSSRSFVTRITGILNFDPEVYSYDELFTTVNFISSKVHQKFKNRENLEVAYNRKESIDGTILPGFSSDFIDVELRGIIGGSTAICKAVYPYELFTRVLQIICDLDYSALVSSVFGRSDLGYVESGEFAELLVSKGLLMRGWEPAGDSLTEGTTNLNVKFRDLFSAFSKVLNLGIGILYNETSSRWEFYIEKRNYFYQTTTILTIEPQNISNIQYKLGVEFMHSSVETGFTKYAEDSNYGLSEYNTKSEFSTPITVTDSKFNCVSNIRADGIGIQLAIDNQREVFSTEQEQADTDIDEDLFFLDAIEDETSGTLQTRRNEGFQLIDGLYGEDIIQANIRVSPLRNMLRWGDWLNAGFSKLQTEKLKFCKTEGLSTLESQLDEETASLRETNDYDISNLAEPRWSGRIVMFDAALSRAQINTILDNPYGLVKYWDYIDRVYRYGWIKECGTDRVDRDSNWMLYEATNIDSIANNLVFVSDSEDILLMNGSTTIKVLA